MLNSSECVIDDSKNKKSFHFVLIFLAETFFFLRQLYAGKFGILNLNYRKWYVKERVHTVPVQIIPYRTGTVQSMIRTYIRRQKVIM